MKVPPLTLPREHGAWAVLIVPALSAAILTHTVSVDFFLLLGATLMVFMSHAPLLVILREFSDARQPRAKYEQARFWATAYFVFAFAFVLPLLLRGYESLVPIGLVALAALAATYFLTRNAPRTIPADLVAVIGLTLSGPASYYVLTGGFDRTSLLLWMFNLLFFGYCVFYVHEKMKASATKKPVLTLRDKWRLGKHLIAYQVLALGILIFLMLSNAAPRSTLLAFVPVTTQSIYGTVNLSGRVRFRTLGYVLLGQSVVFAILVGTLK